MLIIKVIDLPDNKAASLFWPCPCFEAALSPHHPKYPRYLESTLEKCEND